jgi:hypothetical protein
MKYLSMDVRMPLIVGSALTDLVRVHCTHLQSCCLSCLLFRSRPVLQRALQCCVAMATPFDTVLYSLLHYHRIINFYVPALLGTATAFASGLCDVFGRYHLILLFRSHFCCDDCGMLTPPSAERPILRAFL